MKAIRSDFLIGGAMVLALVFPAGAQDGPARTDVGTHASDPSICIDGMETVPGSDDLEPTLAAADGGCATPQVPVSI